MNMKKILLGAAGGLAAMLAATPSLAQKILLGQIVETPYNYCPVNFLPANGQILPIAQNTALYSLLGTTYGGNGQTTFALPDLRGRAGIHLGQGPGLPSYVLGEIGGTETTTLTLSQLPSHSHVGNLIGTSAGPDSEKVKKSAPATFPPGTEGQYNRTVPPTVAMAAGAVTTDPAGGGQPFSNRDPYLTMNYCIAVAGIFPAHP